MIKLINKVFPPPAGESRNVNEGIFDDILFRKLS